MTSYREDEKYLKDVIIPSLDSSLLGSAITWISKNLVPEDVFEPKELEEWARENGFFKPGETP